MSNLPRPITSQDILKICGVQQPTMRKLAPLNLKVVQRKDFFIPTSTWFGLYDTEKESEDALRSVSSRSLVGSYLVTSKNVSLLVYF